MRNLLRRIGWFRSCLGSNAPKVAERQIHDPEQINLSDLRKDGVYVLRDDSSSKTSAIRVLSISGRKIKVIEQSSDWTLRKKYDAAELGIAPFPNGNWHANKYIVPYVDVRFAV
ncbi:MAG: hypothetical protein WC548_01520 [Candidatus Pacearchaeota archaeon]